MRTYVVNIDADYLEGQPRQRLRNVEGYEPLYNEFDKEYCVAVARGEAGWGSAPEFLVLVYGGAFADNGALVRGLVADACRMWGLDLEGDIRRSLGVREVPADRVLRNLSGGPASRLHNVLVGTNTWELYSSMHGWRSAPVTDSLVGKALTRDEALVAAAATGYAGCLGAEVERIFLQSEAAPAQDAPYIPVHYLVEGLGTTGCERAVDVLTGSLSACGRLPSDHLYRLSFDRAMYDLKHDHDLDDVLNDKLMACLEDNTLVIEYREHEPGTSDTDAYKLFRRAVRLANRHLDRLQLLFAIPEGADDLARRIQEACATPLVTIAPDSGRGDLNSPGSFAALCAMEGQEPQGAEASLRAYFELQRRVSPTKTVESVAAEWERMRLARGAYPLYAESYDAFLVEAGADADASDELDALIGLEPVKERLHEVVDRLRMNALLAREGLPARPFSLHMAFLGNPGTGKTEVANIYARMLAQAGVLPEGRVIQTTGVRLCREGADKVFEAARGSVLFVDEAYGMLPYPSEISELLVQMEARRGDTVVILAGYEGRMGALLDSNPGFRSRLGFTLRFPDYTPDELLRIFGLMVSRQGMTLGDGAERAARDALARAGRRTDQGNARFVRKLFEDCLGAQQARLARELGEGAVPDQAGLRERLRRIEAADVEAAAGGTADGGDGRDDSLSGRGRLERLVGLKDVKRSVSDFLDFARVQKAMRDRGLQASPVSLHMALTGNPGTGKTEVARLIGRILREEGVLSVGDLYECGRKDLVSPIVGQTPRTVAALFEKAHGSVLFIDEAYALTDGGKGGPGNEAVTAIVDAMEKYRDEVVVILAGYTREIENLLGTNPGLASRVRTRIDFPDYSAEELYEILALMAGDRGLTLGVGVREAFLGRIGRAMREDNFGNARAARNMLEAGMLAQAARIARESGGDLSRVADERLTTLEAADFEAGSPEPAGRRAFALGFA